MESNIILITADQLRQIVVEAVDTALQSHNQTSSNGDHLHTHPFGDVEWLYSVCPIPNSTIDQLSARGVIQGKIKIGKRVIYDKTKAMEWIRNHECKNLTTADYEKMAEEQYNRQRMKRSKVQSKLTRNI